MFQPNIFIHTWFVWLNFGKNNIVQNALPGAILLRKSVGEGSRDSSPLTVVRAYYHQFSLFVQKILMIFFCKFQNNTQSYCIYHTLLGYQRGRCLLKRLNELKVRKNVQHANTTSNFYYSIKCKHATEEKQTNMVAVWVRNAAAKCAEVWDDKSDQCVNVGMTNDAWRGFIITLGYGSDKPNIYLYLFVSPTIRCCKLCINKCGILYSSWGVDEIREF